MIVSNSKSKKSARRSNSEDEERIVTMDKCLQLLDQYFGTSVYWKDMSRSKSEQSVSIEAAVELQGGDYFEIIKVLAWDQNQDTAKRLAALRIFQVLGFPIEDSKIPIVNKQVQVVDRPQSHNWRNKLRLPSHSTPPSRSRHYSDDEETAQQYRPRSSWHRSQSAKSVIQGSGGGSGESRKGSAGKSDAHLPPKKKKHSRWLKGKGGKDLDSQDGMDMETYLKRRELYIQQCQNYMNNVTDALDEDNLDDEDEHDIPPHLRKLDNVQKQQQQQQVSSSSYQQQSEENMGEELGTESVGLEEDFIPLESGDDEEEGEIRED
eukprot:TRINITY_DN6863_c0_g2_i4.p1 TRINITY_DN6863_c0_g2~~TRINITY_DN6863_c0_g2_i4.p1  ORF type:complete len:320 (+),score=58.26 TRINITY_DN6863_c0_g2_i4:155-1114(+)